MTDLWDVTFEDNRLYHATTGFTGLFVSGGTIETAGAAAHSGTYGCVVTPLQSYRTAGYRYAGILTRFRQRFYLHPNGITIPTTRSINICRNYYADNSRGIYRLNLRYETGIGYQISGSVGDNTDDAAYSLWPTTHTLEEQADWNYIETDWYAAAPGFFRVWINGSSVWDQAVTNSNLRVKYPFLGSIWPLYAISGSFYVDDWKANDDGTAIGA